MSLQSMYQETLARIQTVLADDNLELGRKYGRITDLLLASRVDHLRRGLLGGLEAATVQSGPFEGMRFHAQATEGCYIPKLLGCYEEELHPLIHRFAETKPYDRVINVGCAEGYYAVGLARCLPGASILAFDINPAAQRFCKGLAELNDVSERVLVGGRVSLADWPGLIDERVLIVSDCEGAEYELLSPGNCKDLLRADLLIELHRTDTDPQLAENLLKEYSETHDLELIAHGGRNPCRFEALQPRKHLDQLLAVWEFRGGPTPWAFLKARS